MVLSTKEVMDIVTKNIEQKYEASITHYESKIYCTQDEIEKIKPGEYLLKLKPDSNVFKMILDKGKIIMNINNQDILNMLKKSYPNREIKLTYKVFGKFNDDLYGEFLGDLSIEAHIDD